MTPETQKFDEEGCNPATSPEILVSGKSGREEERKPGASGTGSCCPSRRTACGRVSLAVRVGVSVVR